ncbi:MAG: hypothetical protein KKA65_01955 [Nanoarchaeota archaeon]|nr:hypothetical protein [Nanoarchaeota archaeon]MBU4241950.1 hypothetical protein [Nanoarchaeota archaeon]MBU4352201.1 hypothetical protein [Nanoarchaeota archaeon]MBU4456241.1 hypothetical protein [Nanoarchaeota archaeon]MCG2719377.1 hypothetical protein [Nanoarchaeota archaeon]
MKNVILDTNFIIYSLSFKIDLEAELNRIADFTYQISILKASIDELERLINESKLFEKRLIKIALKYIEQKSLNIIDKKGHVDDILVEMDPKTNIIATQDKALKKRLKEKGFKIITIRQKKHLRIE